MRFVEGLDRGQSTLFPASLDDYVTEDNPVRAVDVFVDGLDLDKLGFVGVQPLDTNDLLLELLDLAFQPRNASLSWCRLSEQNLRIDRWSLCRG
jgi:hypothetical protein